MIDVRRLEAALRSDDSGAVASAFFGASESDRKQVRPFLRALEKERSEYWRTGRRPARPVGEFALDTARLATTPSAEGAASVLRGGDHPVRTQVILERQVSWLPKLLVLLTNVSVSAETGRAEVPWQVVDALLDRCSLSHLDTPDYALNYLRRQDPRLDAAAQLAVDPALPHLLLRALESDRLHDAVVADWINPHAKGRERRWAEIAAAWAARGALDRAELHRRVVAALIRGGMQPHLRVLVWILEELAPDPAEARLLLRDYLALLDSRHGFVAARALRSVRAVDAEEHLVAATLTDACTRLLSRADTSLPQAALSWLRLLAAREPASVSQVVRAATVGLGHPKRAVQEKALALIEHLGPVDDASSAEVAWALEGVDATVRGATVRASAVLPERPPLPACPPVTPVTSGDELVDLARRIASVDGRFGDDERLLNGVAEFGARLTPGQRTELSQHRPGWGLTDLLIDGVTRPAPGFLGRLLGSAPGTRRNGITRGQGERADDVVAAVRAGTSAPLVSFPRDASGLVDPDAVVAGLERALSERRRVPATDLEVAWLRLPLHHSADLAPRIAAVGGPDAAWLSAQLAHPLEPPVLMLQNDQLERSTGAEVRLLGSWPGARGRGGKVLASWADLPALDRYDLSTQLPEVALFPTQRELLAAYLLRTVSFWMGEQASMLALLPHQEGPTGATTATLLALGASSDQIPARAGAVDATLGLLATGQITGDAAGDAWARLVPHHQVKLPRWHAHLRDVAGSSVAGNQYVWDVLRQVLSLGLPTGLAKRAGAADLVGLAAEAALAIGAGGEVPGLAEVAERPGRSRIATEARRLRDVLRGGTGAG